MDEILKDCSNLFLGESGKGGEGAWHQNLYLNEYLLGEHNIFAHPHFPFYFSVLFLFLIWFSMMGFEFATWPGKNKFGPKQNFFLVNTIEVMKNQTRLVAWMTDLTLKYYPTQTWQFRILGMPKYFIVTTPESCEYILKTNFANYGKGPVWYNVFVHLLGNGIFNTDGPLWDHQRKVAAHMFKKNSFKGFMLNAVRDKCKNLVTIIDTKMKKENSNSIEIDMADYYFRFTLDSIGEIAFGQDLRSLFGENEDFMRAFDYSQVYTADLFFIPIPQPIMNRFTAAGRKYMACIKIIQEFSSAVVGTAVKNALEEQEAKREKNKVSSDDDEDDDNEDISRSDILSLFLKRGIPDLTHYDARHGNKMNKVTAKDRETLNLKSVSAGLNSNDIKFLKDTILNFIIAGRDTTAQALAWMTYLISERPDIQERMTKEIKEIFGDDLYQDLSMTEEESIAHLSHITYEKIEKCNYLHCVVLETLRLYPSIPKDGKWSYKKDVLPDGTKIPANSWLIFVPFAMGRNTNIWGEDATSFRPERFVEMYSKQNNDHNNSNNRSSSTFDFEGREGKEETKARLENHPYHGIRHDHCPDFVSNIKFDNLKSNELKIKKEPDTKFTAFQAGPRLCLGQKLALMEAKLCIAKLVANYQISLVKGQVVEPVWNSASLPMKNALKIQLTKKYEVQNPAF